MVEAMKYRIKDKQLEKLIYSIFDEADVQSQIEEQIDEDWYNVKLSSSDFDKTELCATKMNPDYEDLNEDHGSISIFIRKEVIERIPEYKPDKWNLYPDIKPPKEGRYLIQWGNGNDEPFFSIRTWEEENPWRGNFVFRELPEPYLGEDLKEEVKAEEIF